MKKYPFKFLDAYNKEDKAIFFGREEELEDLYRLVFQTNLLLLYGASGTGKTSLIHCGLANRFKPSQWLDLYIRRGSDINQSLLETIRKRTPAKATAAKPAEEELEWFESMLAEEKETEAQPGELPTVQSDNPVAQALQDLYLATFTPIYLIFDQFEELYTLGNAAEQRQFIRTIEELVQIPLPLKIIIVMREEYLANIYDLEKAVPQLRNKKLRIEPMDLPRVEQVILNATVHNPDSNVELEQGKEEAIAKAVIEKVREGDVNVKLPYLQVFMDRLYQEATGEEIDRSREAHLDLDLVDRVGDISDVLADFIETQSRRIYRKLAQSYKDLPTDIVWQILSPFATVDGTKAPIKQEDLTAIQQSLTLPETDRTRRLIKEAVAELETGRILRYRKEEHTYEVVHDTLARVIAEKRSEEEKAYLKARRMVTEGYATYQDTGTLLSREQLAFIQPYEERLETEIDGDQQTFIEESKRKRKRQRILLWSGVAAAFAVALAVIFLVIGEQQETAAALAQVRAEEQKTVAALAESQKNEAEANRQTKLANEAREEADSNARIAQQKTAEVAATLTDLQRSNANVVRLILQNAEQDVLKLQYENALRKIKAAAELDALSEDVAQAFLEIAFWHNEAGHIQRAVGILDSAAALVKKESLIPRLQQIPADTTAARTQLRSTLQRFDNATYQFLRERYYPIMVDVPGGTFTMGCDPAIDKGCQDNEPQHPATVADFQIAKYETTWWQYFLFCQATGYEYESPGWGTDGNNPAVNVSWYDAVEYANWVSRQLGLEEAITGDEDYQVDLQSPGYRLPTEAEWEFAAKGGRPDQANIYSGSNTLEEVGWYGSNSDTGDGVNRTRPVGLKKANALGLHDMSGNVWEWCWDWYGTYPESSGVDDAGPPDGRSRVLRGGSWVNVVGYCRVANRSNGFLEDWGVNVGFRLSRAQ